MAVITVTNLNEYNAARSSLSRLDGQIESYSRIQEDIKVYRAELENNRSYLNGVIRDFEKKYLDGFRVDITD